MGILGPCYSLWPCEKYRWCRDGGLCVYHANLLACTLWDTGWVPWSQDLWGDPEYFAVWGPGWPGTWQCAPRGHRWGSWTLPSPGWGWGTGAGEDWACAADPHQAPRWQGPPPPVSRQEDWATFLHPPSSLPTLPHSDPMQASSTFQFPWSLEILL